MHYISLRGILFLWYNLCRQSFSPPSLALPVAVAMTWPAFRHNGLLSSCHCYPCDPSASSPPFWKLCIPQAVCLQAVLHLWGSAHHWARGASDPGGSLRNFRASQNDSSTETWRMEMQAGIHKAEERIHNYILLPINAKVTFDRTISCKPLRFPLHLVTWEFFY